jgi:quercetin dioxygenase-like cupin family protein
MRLITTTIVLMFSLSLAHAQTAQRGSKQAQSITIARSGSEAPTQGQAEYFTGSVRIDPLFPVTEPARASGARVTFEPGARTAWHMHPLGQTLIVTAGTWWVQQEGGPVQAMREGDVVRIPPGVKHWHGATTTTRMAHIAIHEQLNGKVVEWMEKVSDDQYRP